ncbi:M56 family metallopeptidase [Planctomicrobium sp. SH664]|uniref:M56 family metallopeptidase n=1 Tax=Planctomicrobium sp. SH664 TaxID=3448125 RepID=UPI003F5B6BE3
MTPIQFLEVVVSISLQATLVVCGTHWCCRFVTAPRLQCRLWNACHLLLLLVALCGVLFPHLRPGQFWPQFPVQSLEQVVITQTIVGRAAFVIWLAGAGISVLLLAYEWQRVFRFLRSCRIASPREVSLIWPTGQDGTAAPQPTQKRPVQLLVSPHLGSPFCCQWHEPQLVIPEFLLERDQKEIQIVVRHELEHLGSGHPLQLFIERLVATLFWFHPAIWWAAQQSSLTREFACDDAAVAADRQEIVNYLKVLVALAERGLTEETEGAALFFGRGASVIALRGRRLVNRVNSPTPEPNEKPTAWGYLALATCAVAAWLIWIPVDGLASTRSHWSPWPRWSAGVLHVLEIPARDFEPYEVRTRLYELSTRTHTDVQRPANSP